MSSRQKKHTSSVSDEDFRALLHRAGLKATPARLAMLKIIQAAPSPLSAQAIVKKAPRGVDQATIYRMIKALTLAGILRYIDFQHGHAHYEFTDTAEHHHLICSACGMAEDVPGCEVEGMNESILRSSKKFSTISHHSLEFFGLCNTCEKK